ncbi:hypothetical protein EVAR_35718_1 [Eumeta japonica]|uniref:Uncharacterized protein n=1 Tax=Eumeta variegata TaxID=151549 RepID=A0A4C1VH49_EUMVA|nr:hypothetical protein EVAR_35718_1 [Eumeta japonica]
MRQRLRPVPTPTDKGVEAHERTVLQNDLYLHFHHSFAQQTQAAYYSSGNNGLYGCRGVNLLRERVLVRIVVEFGGAVYIVGGRTRDDAGANDVLRYAPARAEWRRLRPLLLLPRDDGCLNNTAAAVHGQNLYVVGGWNKEMQSTSAVRCYNLETAKTERWFLRLLHEEPTLMDELKTTASLLTTKCDLCVLRSQVFLEI